MSCWSYGIPVLPVLQGGSFTHFATGLPLDGILFQTRCLSGQYGFWYVCIKCKVTDLCLRIFCRAILQPHLLYLIQFYPCLIIMVSCKLICKYNRSLTKNLYCSGYTKNGNLLSHWNAWFHKFGQTFDKRLRSCLRWLCSVSEWPVPSPSSVPDFSFLLMRS